MRKLGLLGKKIAHSKSQLMYEDILQENVDYTLFDYNLTTEIPDLNYFFDIVQGLSITSPYKEHFLEKVHMSEQVRKINAINCIKKSKDIYYATNTDYSAIHELILGAEFNLENSAVVILGSGVMSRVIQEIFREIKFVNYEVLCRGIDGPLENIEIRDRKTQLILINCCARNFEFKGKVQYNTIFWDLNYNFEPHKYLHHAVKKYIDGLSLLRLQAKHALKFWGVVD